MPCLFRYRWLKLPRAALPQGKGLSAYWARLAARAAFRKGVASYCGHENPVEPGMWSGGVVGLKSILGVKKRERALEILEQLSALDYLNYELNNNSLCTAANAEAVLSFLRDRGILEDDGATPQQVEEKKRKQAYHNTLLLLTNYRSILWQTESELESVAAELNLPLRKLDAVLSRIDAEIGMENRRLELRLERLAKTRQLLDQINDALTSLKHKTVLDHSHISSK